MLGGREGGEEVLPSIFLENALIAGRIWKGDLLMADTEDLEIWMRQPRRLNAKEILMTQEGEEFAFVVADGMAKLSRRDYEFREPTPRREQTVRSESSSEELQGEPE